MTPSILHCWRPALAGLLLAGALQARAADLVSEQVVVVGAVRQSLTLTVDDLKAFPATQIESVSVTRRQGDPSVVRGVKLTALLERAGLVNADPNDWKHAIVLVTATDGYQVVFSWPELFDTDVGAGALVVFERDGRPLAEREGRIALVSARDHRAGPRSVRSVSRFEVRVIR